MAKSLEVASKPGDIITIKAKVTNVHFSEDNQVYYDAVCLDKDDLPYKFTGVYGVKEDSILSVKND